VVKVELREDRHQALSPVVRDATQTHKWIAQIPTETVRTMGEASAQSVCSRQDQDSDYETDEECLVHVSVSGILQEDLSLLSRDQFSFLDIHSQRPLITIGGQAFLGQYEDTVGSSVFFTRKTNTSVTDQVFGRQANTQLTYLAATRKKLQLKRVFLNKKAEEKKATEGSCVVGGDNGHSGVLTDVSSN